VAFGGLAGVFASGLGRDPSRIPSALTGQAVPKFSLPPVMERTLGLASGNLPGEVSLVNVFASWCVACRKEHPVLMRLASEGVVTIHGLNYKDEPENASRWLNANGDPYTRTGADRDGRVAIDWGVYGVPETLVVGADGRIAFKHIGPLSEEALDRTILPLIAQLRGKAGA
jgi:cytochrome c biogenesis protein CcmG/thiol:disulfide interchange protein DsbE